jgi:Helix-turn-helix domain of resolvase
MIASPLVICGKAEYSASPNARQPCPRRSNAVMVTWLAAGPIHLRVVEQARIVKLGRKPEVTEHEKREGIKRRDTGNEALADIARSYNVSRSTISRLPA